jgi:uncharacterized protein YceK
MKFERPPTLWIGWFLFVVALIVGSLLFSGCATTTEYRGPDYSHPMVRVQEWMHWNTSTNPRQPHWEKRRFIVFENPLYRNVSFDVDCENAIFHVDVPARKVQQLLITPEDGACDIKRVPDRTL